MVIGGGLLAFAVHAWSQGGGVTPGVLLGGFSGGGMGLTGVGMRFARGVIELNGDQLRAGDRLLGFGWMRTYATSGLRRLQVSTSTATTNGGPPKPMPNFALLIGTDHDDNAYRRGDAVLAWGYPRDWLRVVADDLAERLPSDARVDGGTRGRVRVVETLADGTDGADPEDESVPPQPAESRVLVERGDDHLNFIVAGGRDHGLGAFAWIWNGFVAVFVVVMAAKGVSGGFATRDLLVLAGVLLLFGGVGVGVAATAFRWRRTRTILDIAGHGPTASLTLRTDAPFTGERVRRWSVKELAAVRVDRSGMEVNDRPVMHLRLCPVEGKRVGTLASLSHAELSWIAAEIRHQTGLPRRAPE